MLLRPRLIAPLVVLALALVAGVAWVWHDRASAAETPLCRAFHQQSRERAAAVSGHGGRVVVIGDSWSSGRGLLDPARSWPVRLPGRVYVDGFPGSGFSEHASGCRRVSYADRAPADLRHGTSLVVVEGGLNDYDQSDAAITRGFGRLMTELRGQRVVVVGPVAAPSRAAAMPRVDRLLARLSSAAHVPYYSALGLGLSYQPDLLHPGQDGHDVFGRDVAAYLRSH